MVISPWRCVCLVANHWPVDLAGCCVARRYERIRSREADPEFVEKFQWNAAVVIKTCASRQLKYPKAQTPRGSEGKARESYCAPKIDLRSNARSNVQSSKFRHSGPGSGDDQALRTHL